MNRIANMEARLSEQEKRRLRRVYAPQVICTAPSNAWMDMCVLPDGEIRYYGHDDMGRYYLSSIDCGFTWKRYEVEDMSAMTSSVLNEHTGRWFCSHYVRGEAGWHSVEMPAPPAGLDGWFAVLSDEGPGGKTKWVKITDLNIVPRTPVVLRSRSRVLIPGQFSSRPQRPVIARSDDNGETWQLSILDPAPPHEAGGFHLSTRWQNGSAEPTLIERSDGSLLLITRTSQDFHYQYESFDGGETWSAPVPSPFHGTLTMPTLMRMSTGELVFFFCNTQPLAEVDKSTVWPPLDDGEMRGLVEDVFTNRDANHAAISLDDGKTWRGFRELMLNPLRNDADFRTKGGNAGCLDKSVHQFQAIELPYGKILLVCGQHEWVRKILLLDPKWLLETERGEDFSCGLISVSTHVYLKSVSGNIRAKSGHCAWNRTNGAVLLPDPDGNYEEALYLRTVQDDLLVSPMQGMVWNFPAAHRGTVSLRVMVLEDGLRLTLTDRWFNPIDPHAAALSRFSIRADAALCPPGQWTDIALRFDEEKCTFLVNGRPAGELPPACPAPNGLCYLVAQTAPEYTGKKGAYIKRMSMNAE